MKEVNVCREHVLVFFPLKVFGVKCVLIWDISHENGVFSSLSYLSFLSLYTGSFQLKLCFLPRIFITLRPRPCSPLATFGRSELCQTGVTVH